MQAKSGRVMDDTQSPVRLSRRSFFPAGAALAAVASGGGLREAAAQELPLELAQALAKIEPYLFTQEAFIDVSRGTPLPHSLLLAKKEEVGLTRETRKLEVVSDPEKPATPGRQHSQADGTAPTFSALLLESRP